MAAKRTAVLRARPSGRTQIGLIGQAGFDFQLDLDLVAHHDAAVEQRVVEAHAEVAAVDLGRGGEGDHGLALLHGCALAQVLQVELHRLGDAADGEVGGELPLGVGHLLEPGALEGDGRVVLDVEEVVRAQVVVAHGLVGVDAGRLDLGLERGVLGVLGDGEGAGELGEAAPDLGADQVAGDKADLGVRRVDGVGPYLGQGDVWSLLMMASSVASEYSLIG